MPALMIAAAKPTEAGLIKLPEGMDTEEKQPGDTIEFVGEGKLMPDGMLKVTKINGMDISGDGKSPMKEEPDGDEGKDSFMSSVMPPEEGE